MLSTQSPWVTNSTHTGGTVRWQAPELMAGGAEDDDENIEGGADKYQNFASPKSDVYAWAMTYLVRVTVPCANKGLTIIFRKS